MRKTKLEEALDQIRLASSGLERANAAINHLLERTAPRSVLIVEDDADVRASLSALLSGHGYRVVEAPCGRLGLDALREHRPGAVLLDLMMTPVSGWDVLQEMHKDPAISGTPVLVISATSGPLPNGVPGMRKPFDLEKLVDVVDRLCGV